MDTKGATTMGIEKILRLRPQHFFCEMFLHTYYPDMALMRFLTEVRRILHCETSYVVQVVPMGEEDDICRRCPSMPKDECTHEDRWEFAGADMAVLHACGLQYGETLTLEQIRHLARQKAPMKYCMTCPFRKSRECEMAVRNLQVAWD